MDVNPTITRREWKSFPDQPGGHRGGLTSWASALLVFSGEGHDADLAARLRARGLRVEAYDTKDGGQSHNVLNIYETLLARVTRGEFDVIFIATPCQSYSIRHR